MTLTSTRPENRHGRAHEAVDWPDTVPLCFRSEAFPEDLPCAEDTPVATLGAAQSRRGFWPQSPPSR